MKGYLAIIAASLLYGIMPVLSKLLLLEGMNSSSIVVWRFCFSTVFCLAIMLIKKIPFQATPRQIGVMIVVGILGFGMTATLVTAAYNYIPVGLATMFQFSYPLFVLIIMVILTKEKIGALRAVAVAFLAVGLVLMMDFSGGANYTGIALALLSGVTYAFYVVSNQRSCFRMLDGFTTMFYAMVASSIFFTLQSLVSGQLMAPPTPKSWLLHRVFLAAPAVWHQRAGSVKRVDFKYFRAADQPDIRSPDLWGPAEHPYDDRMRAGDSRYFAGIPGG